MERFNPTMQSTSDSPNPIIASAPPVYTQPPSTPILLFDNNLQEYWLNCRFEDKSIAQEAGLSWNPVSKRWRCSDDFTALALRHYADAATEARLAAIVPVLQAQVEASQQAVSDINPPAPLGYQYLPYQKAGIGYAIQKEGTLIADEMGLGKTIQAIGLINLMVAQKRAEAPNSRLILSVLIVVPASLKLNWIKELSRWLDKRITYSAPEKSSTILSNVVVIHYDMLAKVVSRYKERLWDVIIADEVHYIKNTSTIRYKLFSQLKGKKRVGLTGTPVVNRVPELFPLINWLDPATFPSQMAFLRRYQATTPQGKPIKNSGKNLEELNLKLRSTIMIRRTKNQVLKELPPKRRQIIEFPLSLLKDSSRVAALLEQEKQEFQNRAALLEPIREAMNRALQANNTEEHQKALQAFRSQTFQILGQIATIRKETALAKIPVIIPFLEECIISSGKVVCFAHHHEVIDRIHDNFGKRAVRFDGRMSMRDRDESVTSFQENPNIDLAIVSIRAGGLGITLTASSHCVFSELDWVPGVVKQAEDRLHRIGQLSSVLVQHTILENSLDLKIAKDLIEKQEAIDKITGDNICERIG